MVSILAALHVVEAVLDAIPIIAAVLDDSGHIVAVNAAWRRFAVANGLRLRNVGVGANYLDVCDRAKGEGEIEARQAAGAIREVTGGNRSDYRLRYTCHSPEEFRWFEFWAGPMEIVGERFILVLHRDVSDEMLIGMKLHQHAGEIGQLVEGLVQPDKRDMIGVACELAQQNVIGARLALLTARERQVHDLVIDGQGNKQIARQLGLSTKTVEVHRSTVMRKMQARSLAELVRMATLFKFRGGPAISPTIRTGENPN